MSRYTIHVIDFTPVSQRPCPYFSSVEGFFRMYELEKGCKTGLLFSRIVECLCSQCIKRNILHV